MEEDFSAVPDLEKRIAEEKDASMQAKYHLQLAWLYSNYKNPKKDYRKALEEFELYLSRVPEGGQTDEIQNWVSVLQALERSQERNASLEEAIKRLKTLNLQMEKKRKSTK